MFGMYAVAWFVYIYMDIHYVTYVERAIYIYTYRYTHYVVCVSIKIIHILYVYWIL